MKSLVLFCKKNEKYSQSSKKDGKYFHKKSNKSSHKSNPCVVMTVLHPDANEHFSKSTLKRRAF